MTDADGIDHPPYFTKRECQEEERREQESGPWTS